LVIFSPETTVKYPLWWRESSSTWNGTEDRTA